MLDMGKSSIRHSFSAQKINTADLLNSLYNQTYEETKHYRDAEWRITAVIVSLLIGISAIVHTLSIPLQYERLFRIILSVFTVLVAFFGIYYLREVHKKLNSNREMRRTIEKISGLFDFLPAELKGDLDSESKKIFSAMNAFRIIVLASSLCTLYSILSVP